MDVRPPPVIPSCRVANALFLGLLLRFKSSEENHGYCRDALRCRPRGRHADLRPPALRCPGPFPAAMPPPTVTGGLDVGFGIERGVAGARMRRCCVAKTCVGGPDQEGLPGGRARQGPPAGPHCSRAGWSDAVERQWAREGGGSPAAVARPPLAALTPCRRLPPPPSCSSRPLSGPSRASRAPLPCSSAPLSPRPWPAASPPRAPRCAAMRSGGGGAAAAARGAIPALHPAPPGLLVEDSRAAGLS